ncbi:MAG: Rrf2 family transcriptional regulator [Gaiellales bacterium]|nr:MAG: Rrf2 family transcriptional regulator [Gaiellales bacterium]
MVMLISSKSEYGLLALMDIALHQQDGPVNRSHVAERQQVPLPYLTQVLRELVNGGLLESTRGPSGGYTLAADPARISLLDVVMVLQGAVSPATCAGSDSDSGCGRLEGCVLASVWSRLKSANEDVLKETMLADILKGEPAGEAAAELAPDDKLDCIGVACPMPIVKISQKMRELRPGGILEVWADDEGAKADIPAWCIGSGNEFIGREEYGDQMKFLIQKAL